MTSILIYYVTLSSVRKPFLLLALIFALMADLFLLFTQQEAYALGLISLSVSLFFYAILFLVHRDRWYNINLVFIGLILGIACLGQLFIFRNTEFSSVGTILFLVSSSLFLYFGFTRRRITFGYTQIWQGAILLIAGHYIYAMDLFIIELGRLKAMYLIASILGTYFIVEGMMKYESTLPPGKS